MQILFVLLFAGNLLALWAVILMKKCGWYRFAGYWLLLVIPLLTVFFDQPRFELDYYWWKIAGAAAIVAGTALGLWAKRENRSWVETRPQDLVIAGPYQYFRHPIYLGLIFIIVGWWWLWAAVYSFYFGMLILALIWINAYLEEKLILEQQFAGKYQEYKTQTGMFWVK